MSNEIRIGVVLVNYHTNRQTIETASKYSSYESISKVVIVNNDAIEEYFMDEVDIKKIIVINNRENLGYSKGNNLGINKLAEESCKYIIISNSDVYVEEDCIIKCVDYIEKDNSIGLIAPRMEFPGGGIAPLRFIPLNYLRILLRVIIPEPIFDRWFENRVLIVNDLAFQSYVPGSFFIINGSAIADEPFFDPDIFLYREEEILGERIKKRGFRIAIAMNLTFLHNHLYQNEPYEYMKKMSNQMMKSEEVLFKKYYKANKLQMVYVHIMQQMFLIVRCVFWKAKDWKRVRKMRRKQKRS